jgi:aminopeptidase
VARPPDPPRRTNSSASRIAVAAVDFELVSAAQRVVQGSLGVVPGERLVLVVDEARRDLGDALDATAKNLGAKSEIILLESLGPRPVRVLPAQLAEALAGAQTSALVIGADDAEFTMRRELLDLVRQNGIRHAHMIGITRRTMATGFSVDPVRLLDATRAVRTRLHPDSVLHLRTRAGSDLVVEVSPRSLWSVHDGAIRAGRWENLPAGELTTSPERVDGIYVADASLGGQIGSRAGLLTNKPVRVEIEGGVCKKIDCVDRALAREVEAFLAREHNLNRVGMVTLGTNVGILQPIGEFICDQNLPGLHISFGSVSPELTGATFQTRAHIMMTCAEADVDLDGAPLMRHGRYLVT